MIATARAAADERDRAAQLAYQEAQAKRFEIGRLIETAPLDADDLAWIRRVIANQEQQLRTHANERTEDQVRPEGEVARQRLGDGWIERYWVGGRRWVRTCERGGGRQVTSACGISASSRTQATRDDFFGRGHRLIECPHDTHRASFLVGRLPVSQCQRQCPPRTSATQDVLSERAQGTMHNARSQHDTAWRYLHYPLPWTPTTQPLKPTSPYRRDQVR